MDFKKFNVILISIFPILSIPGFVNGFQELSKLRPNTRTRATEFLCGNSYSVSEIGLDFRGPYIAKAESHPTFIFPIIKADNVSLKKQVPFVLVIDERHNVSSTIKFSNVQRTRILTAGGLRFEKTKTENQSETLSSISIKHTIGHLFDNKYRESMEYSTPDMQANESKTFDLEKGRVFKITFDELSGISSIKQQSINIFSPSLITIGDTAEKNIERLVSWWKGGQNEDRSNKKMINNSEDEDK